MKSKPKRSGGKVGTAAAGLGPSLRDAAHCFGDAVAARLQGLDITTPQSQLTVLSHIDADGSRPAELARRLSISRQALARTLADMLAAALVEQTPDTSDRRATIIRLSPVGLKTSAALQNAQAEVESALREQLGDKTMRRLHKALPPLAAALSSGVGRPV